MNRARLLILLALIANAAGAEEVETTPLPVKAEPAFTKLRIARPVVLTHAGDGSNRVFVASQLGVVHSFANRQDAASTEVFLDIKERVVYKEAENEEGFLGMAFHPNFKQTGEVFVYYTTTDAPHTSVVSRFRLSPNNPRRADPDSEQELLRIKQPFWNHNGGTLAFGPDGYLYIGLGDGGKANDPLKAGQDLGNWLGSILRIDVDKRDEGKNYAIPPDNPFVKRKGAKPEIYAYGLRNIWRLSFDRQTGVCWAGDVGQDFWEEIDIIVKGGNYGWNLREGKHRFHNGSGPRADLIEPIWEYHHAIGKSITGCHVYRGKRVADLVGKYLYADYVSGKIWALHYDVANRRLLGNYSLRSDNLPVLTFGEDEQGEVYFTTQLGGGRIFRFSPIK